jgi:hypothetical protein
MTHLRLSWEEDLKLKIRFLELLFLITTLLVALNRESVSGFLGASLLLFVVFGAMHYFTLSNGILRGKPVIATAFLTSMSFSAVFGAIFFNLKLLEFSQSIAYWAIMSIVIGFGVMPRKRVEKLARKIPLPPSDF